MTHEELKAIAMKRPGVKQAYENPDEEMILYRIINERRQAKLTQSDVAKRMGTTREVVARLESPRRKSTPTIRTIRAYAEACGGTLQIKFIPGKNPSRTAKTGK